MDKVITLELTVLEIMTLVATTSELTSQDDYVAVKDRYGKATAELVMENDIGYETYDKLMRKLELEGIE